MKSSYELAMERLNKTSPPRKLTAAQKAQLAELDSKYGARIAEKELAMREDMDRAAAAGDVEKLEEIRLQLVRERKALQADLEEKKEAFRRSTKR